MATRRRSPWAICVALLGLYGLSCEQAPTAADATASQPQLAKGGDKGKPEDPPLMLTIYGNYAPGSQPGSGDPRILGDGYYALPDSSVYEDGLDGVEATASGSDGGRLIMRTDQNPGTPQFWVDLRGAVLLPAPGAEPLHACGTGDTEPCTGKGYIVTNTNDLESNGDAGLGVLWNDETHQWRLSYGKGCRNDDLKPEHELPGVAETDSQGNPIAWTFEATTQRAWLLRWPISGNWRKGMTCLGSVEAPLRVRFEFTG